MTVPEKVQLFESLSVSDLSNPNANGFEAPIGMPILRFNSNGSIYSPEDRDEEEEKLFIPSTPAHVGVACDIEELIEQRKRVDWRQGVCPQRLETGGV